MPRCPMRALFVALALLAFASPASRAQTESGKALPAIASPPGIAAPRWSRWLARAQAVPLSESDVAGLAALLNEAAREGLPAEPLMLRLEEGVAKRASGEQLLNSVRARRDRLRTAAAMFAEVGRPVADAAGPALIQAAAQALDSGLSESSLRAVLVRGAGMRADSLRAVLDAADALLYNGLDEETVRDLLLDFVEQNLRPAEIARACRFALREYRREGDGARIRLRLWGGTGAGWRGGQGAPEENTAPGGPDSGIDLPSRRGGGNGHGGGGRGPWR